MGSWDRHKESSPPRRVGERKEESRKAQARLFFRTGRGGHRLSLGHVGRRVGVTDRKIGINDSIVLRVLWPIPEDRRVGRAKRNAFAHVMRVGAGRKSHGETQTSLNSLRTFVDLGLPEFLGLLRLGFPHFCGLQPVGFNKLFYLLLDFFSALPSASPRSP